jgi:methoxymalonate biosynthesis acyl carrier protein
MTMRQISACEETLRESIEDSLMAFLKNSLSIDIQSSEHNLIEEGVLDSLMLVDLVLYMEQAFEVSPALEDLEIENFASVSRMADFVAAKASGAWLARQLKRPVTTPGM